MATQQRSYSEKRSSFSKQVLLAVGGVLTLCAALLWLLSIEQVIAASWASIIGALFTILGGVLASLRWVVPSSSPSVQKPSSSSRAVNGLHQQESSECKGSLRVHVKKHLRGTTVNVRRSFDPSFFHAHVIGQDGGYRADFYELEPGNYTVFTHSHAPTAKVTVYAGRVTEVDWRRL